MLRAAGEEKLSLCARGGELFEQRAAAEEVLLELAPQAAKNWAFETPARARMVHETMISALLDRDWGVRCLTPFDVIERLCTYQLTVN